MTALRLLALPAAALLLTACPESKTPAPAGKSALPPVPVHTGTVIQKDVPFHVHTFGNVEPIASVAIKSQVSGDLLEVNFTEGQEVKKGDLLFSIQPRLFATQLAQAEANLARDRALAHSARLNLDRQEALDARGSGVKEDLEKARSLADSTAATVKADEALVLIAQTQLGYATIEAPMDGRTGSIRLRPGNLIRAGDDQPLTTLVQLDPVYVTFTVPEQHLAAIRQGMEDAAHPLQVTARDAKEGRILSRGAVSFIANTVDSATGTIEVKATFPNKDRALWPGAFIDVTLQLTTDKMATVVPSSAVTPSQRGPVVYTVKPDQTAEARAVTVLRTAGEETLIGNGPAPGETVITSGQSRLLPGSKIIPVPDQAKPAAPEVKP